MFKTDALVIGGGVVGLAGALAYAKHGHQVVLLDKAPLQAKSTMPPRWYALNQVSQALLEKLGAWSYLDVNALSPYLGMQVWEGNTLTQIDFDARMVGRDKLGYFVEESVLVNALLHAAEAQERVHLRGGETIVSIRAHDNTREIQTDQDIYQCRQLLVADGANSESRAKLGVGLHSWSYGQDALVCSVKTQKPHRRIAYQVFYPDGPLALLPTQDNHLCSIVWSVPPDRAKHLLSLDESSFEVELQRNFGRRLGTLHLASERTAFPLRMRHTEQYAGDNWLLAGDAAHTVHPLAGLGLNIGLADIAVLEQFLADNKATLASKRQLQAYQRARKTRVWQSILALEAIKRGFASNNPILVHLRRIALGRINMFAPLKRWFIEQADGQSL